MKESNLRFLVSRDPSGSHVGGGTTQDCEAAGRGDEVRLVLVPGDAEEGLYSRYI